MPSWADLGSPGSRARCFRSCSGVWAARGSVAPLDIGAPDGAFRFLLQRRRPGVFGLRGCIPGPHVPLSTLRRRPRERLRMTQGRCGSLLHIRMTLSFTTPRRFNRRTGATKMRFRSVLVALIVIGCALPVLAQTKRKVIIDQDARGPATTDQQSMLVFLQSPQVEILGNTVVSGDMWRDEEVAHTLRMWEIIARTDI